MNGRSDSLRTLAELNERFAHSDAPRIPDYDELLEALKREHGEAGRPDLQPIPRTTSTPNR